MPVFSLPRENGFLKLKERGSLPDAGERAYAYTKACGIIGKSFVGKRIHSLAGVTRLHELDRLIFPAGGRELPGRELLPDLENRILKRAAFQILAVVKSFSHPPQLLVHQLRVYEYSDLKACLNYMAGGLKTPPVFTDIGRFRTIKFEAFPDLEAMLKNTEFEFLLEGDIRGIERGDADLTSLETELDLLYYTGLKNSLRYLTHEDRIFAEKIIAEEISLRNSAWALRLRTYYGKTPMEAEKHLMDIKMRIRTEPPGDVPKWKKQFRAREVSLKEAAAKSLDLPLDVRSAWKGWRWEKFLNPEKPGELWKADPRYFQNAASEHLYNLAMHYFHRIPFSISTSFCYIKLKQFEEDLLTSVAEGMGLGISSRDVFNLLEVEL